MPPFQKPVSELCEISAHDFPLADRILASGESIARQKWTFFC
jgi:hypothetical protein